MSMNVKNITESFPEKKIKSSEKNEKICCTSLTKGISKVKPIGWMVYK
jgi:hypothetical protein